MTASDYSGDNISFEFATSGTLDEAKEYGEDILNTLMSVEGLRGFQLGVTSDPRLCWRTHATRYSTLYVLYESGSLALAAALEKHLVELHRSRWNAGSPRLDNDPDHVRVRGPRGPHFCTYVVVR